MPLVHEPRRSQDPCLTIFREGKQSGVYQTYSNVSSPPQCWSQAVVCVSTPGYTHKAGTSNYVSNIIKSGVCLCLFVTSVCHKICMFEHLSVCNKTCMFEHPFVCLSQFYISMFEQNCILGLSHLNYSKFEQRPPQVANLRKYLIFGRTLKSHLTF